MIAQHLNLISQRIDKQRMVVRIFTAACLCLSLPEGVRPSAVAVAGDPEILPYQYTVFVACLIKLRPLHYGSSPHPDHVHVHLCMHLNLGIVS